MLQNGKARRGLHKEKFLKKHENLAEAAFKEGRAIHERGGDVRHSTSVSNMLKMARRELKYSDKAYDLDIFWGLEKTYSKM